MSFFAKLKKIFTNRPLTIDLLTAMSTLLIISVCIITWYSYIKGRQAIYYMMDMLAKSALNVVSERTVHFLKPAATMAQLTGKITANSGVDFFNINKTDRLETYMTEALRVYPQLSMFYYGTEQGNYIMTMRMTDGSISTHIINRTETPPFTATISRDTAGIVIKEERGDDFSFDHRTRPWYNGAKTTKQNYWTDAYIFFTSQKPGITASFPELDNEGNVHAVIGVDISLDSLSGFLASLDINKQGTAFIVNKKNELIASSDENVVHQINNSYQLKKIADIDDPILNTMYERYLQTGVETIDMIIDNSRYAGVIKPFSFLSTKWHIGIFIESIFFLDILYKTNAIVAFISMLILIIALLVSVLIARSVSRPIMYLADATEKIKDMYLDEPLNLKSHIRELRTMHNSINSMKTGLKAFNKYVPSELVRELIGSGQEVTLGGKRRMLSILFTDIEGFTSISESLPPESVMLHISDYFSELITILLDNKATVDKFIGDSIMAFWGAPTPDTRHAYHACKATLLCLEKLRDLNKKWQLQNKPPLVTRFGIHSGETLVGNIGSDQRMNYTVLGDSVNVASRLEQLNKTFSTSILVSQTTFEQTKDAFLFRPLGKVNVKGRSSDIILYELMDSLGTTDKKTHNLCNAFHKAIQAYDANQWNTALELFLDIRKNHPDDKPTGIFIENCRNMLR
ncbi:MAG: adenylate/guanylate cyclase domain-containing protein [Candidatus Auribacterota bacterium]|nr:adenylate/guanylate cyclase domain-containing protein [Candidatus Auribacterota bacterium]